MIVITEGNKDIRALSSRNYHSDTEYTISQNVICCDIDEGTLLLNTLTGEVILLSSDEYNEIKYKHTENRVLISDLFHHGYLVPVDSIEYLNVEQLRAIVQKRREQRNIITHYNILPTTGCNARCFYCYEYGIKKASMSEDIAKKLIDFIEAHYGENEITLAWFGGEPTLGRKTIDYICSQLSEMNIPYRSRMVSNAYLFDREMVAKAKKLWHLDTIQITLDGTEEIYNKVKAYVNINDNAYQRVLRNIQYFLDEQINVNIRLNMDNHNSEDLNALIDELSGLFGGQKKLNIYVRLLKENAGECPVCHNQDDKDKLDMLYNGIREKLVRNGWSQIWKFTLPSLKPYSCMADDPLSIQITPDGILSKCEDQIYNQVVGSLDEGINNQEQIKKWRERELMEECKKCPFLPSCFKLLKNCPTRTKKCDKEERENRIRLCYSGMIDAYEKWKKDHVNDVK